MSNLEQVKQIVKEVLQLDDSFDSSDRDTLLLGSIPEFDSMAVVLVITTLEEHFDCVFEDDEIDGETFETLGSLSNFIDRKKSH